MQKETFGNWSLTGCGRSSSSFGCGAAPPPAILLIMNLTMQPKLKLLRTQNRKIKASLDEYFVNCEWNDQSRSSSHPLREEKQKEWIISSLLGNNLSAT